MAKTPAVKVSGTLTRTSSSRQQSPILTPTSAEQLGPMRVDVQGQLPRKGQKAMAKAFLPAITKRKSSIQRPVEATDKGARVDQEVQGQSNSQSLGVRSPANPLRPQVTKKEAVAIRHAKVLEQMLSAPSQKCPCLIVKKQNKAVSGELITRKQAVSLKKALLNTKAAPRVISQVRALDGMDAAGFLPGPSPSAAERALVSVQKVDALPEIDKRSDGKSDLLVRARCLLVKRLSVNVAKETEAVNLSSAGSLTSPFPPSKSPLKAVCLGCTDAEAALMALMPDHTPKEDNSTKVSSDTSGNGNSLPAAARASVISLASTAVLSRFGEASGALLRQTAVNDSIHPPLDRMAIFVFWWGFEVTLPSPTMQYLQTAHNISDTVLNVLSMMVMAGGLFEMLPYIRYISMTVDVEFRAIQAVDQGNGAILAATWLMPLALVPRAWDLSLEGQKELQQTASQTHKIKASFAPLALTEPTGQSLIPSDSMVYDPERDPSQEAAIQSALHERFPEDLDPHHVPLPTPREGVVLESLLEEED